MIVIDYIAFTIVSIIFIFIIVITFVSFVTNENKHVIIPLLIATISSLVYFHLIYQSIKIEKMIIILGQTGVGKSTLINEMLDVDVAIVCPTPAACNRRTEPIIHNNIKLDWRKYISLKVIDTVGFSDATKNNDDVLDELLESTKPLRDDIDYMLILLRFGRLTKQDESMLKLIKEKYIKLSDKIIILINRCEGADNFKIGEFTGTVKRVWDSTRIEYNQRVQVISLRSGWWKKNNQDDILELLSVISK